MRNGDFSTEATDVGVVNLSDRRVIADQRKQIADLEAKLADAKSVAVPGLSKKLGSECMHHGTFVVADHELEVNCEACGAKMDPYEVLRKIAHRELNFCYTLNSLRKETELLRKDVERLKATRSRLRTAVQKATPDVGLDDIQAHMKAIGADRMQAVSMVGGDCGVWFYKSQRTIAEGGARTLRGAATAAMAAETTKSVGTST